MSLSRQIKSFGSSVGSAIIHSRLSWTRFQMTDGAHFVLDNNYAKIIHVIFVTRRALPVTHEQSFGTMTKTSKPQEESSNLVIINTTLSVIEGIGQKSLCMKLATKQQNNGVSNVISVQVVVYGGRWESCVHTANPKTTTNCTSKQKSTE
jgi:hypothetical protein